MKRNYIGDCRSEDVVEELFGSVSDFARLVEERGDDFIFENIRIEYDATTDIHYFYVI